VFAVLLLAVIIGIGVLISRQPKRRRIIGFVILAVSLVAAGGLIAWNVRSNARVPSFPSLTDHPDRSLHGTVAYGNFDNVQVRALSGAASKELVSGLGRSGQPYIDEVRWLPDGRLQAFSHGKVRWSTIYDVRTGAIAHVPASGIPTKATPTKSVSVNANGERLRYKSDTGNVSVTVTGPTGTRTIFKTTGGTLYAIGPPTWTPGGMTVLVHDNADRILLITTGTHPTTRVLADHAAILWDTTGKDLLTTQP
jgi:hypothetical protein